MKPPDDPLRERARDLGLWGLLAHWDEITDREIVNRLVAWEETERQRRSLERRIKSAHLDRFKPMADFDWTWPTKIDRAAVEELFTFQFLDEAANVVLVGSNGLGKTMIAQNLAYQALLKGYTVRLVTASEMLNDLVAEDSATARRTRIASFCRPQLLAVDEVGYLSYDHRHADLLFEIVTRRYQQKSTIVTTNKRFKDWKDVFPNAASVVTLVDRLIHKAEVIHVEGESYRRKEADERARAKKRAKPDTTKPTPTKR